MIKITEVLMKHSVRTLIAALAAVTLAGAAHAADAVKIGVIYPLTGNAASAGNSAKDAIELGAEIVNGMHSERKGSALAGGDGLSKLNGAKIELINAGNSAKDAIELGAEIVNGMHSEQKGSALAGGDGLGRSEEQTPELQSHPL